MRSSCASLRWESAHVSAEAPRGIAITPRQQDFLREMVHPLFAEMPQPTFIFDSASNGASKHEVEVSGVVWNLAEEFSVPLKNCARRRESGCSITVTNNYPPEIILSSLALSFYMVDVREGLQLAVICAKADDDSSLFVEAWKQCQAIAKTTMDLLVNVPQLTKHEGSYSWIHQDNSPDSRLERLVAACTTLRFGAALKRQRCSAYRTCFLRCPPLPACQKISRIPHITLSNDTVMDQALQQANRGRKVAAVNAASAYHIGGGFLTGGRHALEEAACMQSTLFYSLQQASRDAEEQNFRDARSRRMHIPEDGIVFSPDVHVFRSGSAQGYVTSKDIGVVRLAAVLSVAMPNQNPRLRDSPLEARKGADYDALLRQKWMAVLDGAAKATVQVLVVPDAGCGVFQNDPARVGHALGEALLHTRCEIDEVFVCGSKSFFDAVCGPLCDSIARSHAEGRSETTTSDHDDGVVTGVRSLGMLPKNTTYKDSGSALHGIRCALDVASDEVRKLIGNETSCKTSASSPLSLEQCEAAFRLAERLMEEIRALSRDAPAVSNQHAKLECKSVMQASTLSKSYVAEVQNEDRSNHNDLCRILTTVPPKKQSGVSSFDIPSCMKIVQEMFDRTYRRIWTHDRERRHCTECPQRVPQRFVVTNIEFKLSGSAHVNYQKVQNRMKSSTNVNQFNTLTADWAASLDPSINEWLLYHGTSLQNARCILRDGFDLKRADSRTTCGIALYFAESITKADEYSPEGREEGAGCTVLLCKVLGGNVKYTDEKDPQSAGVLDNVKRKHDSVLNDRVKCSNTFKEFVVTDPHQVMPLCLVTYQRQYSNHSSP